MHESLYPACGVFIILIAVTVFVMSPTAIQSIISRMRARRTPTHRRTVNSSRPAALPRTTPVTNNGMPPRNSNNSVSSLSSLGNDTSSESASVTTQRTGYNEPQQGIAGLQYYYASQQRRRNRPTLPVQNPYTADEELDGGNTLKSAGLASFNSKIFCDGDMYD